MSEAVEAPPGGGVTGSPIPVGEFGKVLGGQYRLHYHERGTRVEGRPSVVFLHGSGPGASGYSNFIGNMDVVAENGHHVLAVDYLGFGLSDKPEDFDYDTAVQVQALHDLFEQLGISRIVPIGNSLGGYIALEYALKFPEAVEKLILMAPGGVEEPEKWIRDSVGLKTMAKAVRDPTFNEARFTELLGLIVKDRRHLTPEVIAQRWPIAETQPAAVWTRQQSTPIAHRLGEITVPTLVFWGVYDHFIPVRHALVLSEKMQDVVTILSTNAGHWFMIEERELFNDSCIRFLAGELGAKDQSR